VFRKLVAIVPALFFSAVIGLPLPVQAQSSDQKHYEPTVASLDSHPLPVWYADAKLGIFIHWGLYSVPGWAPLHPSHEFTAGDYMLNNPYSEWYYNTVRIPNSPTAQYDREHYGANHNYYDFTADFNKETKKWNPDTMAAIFRDAGAKYVVLTTKHHEGFTLWPSKVANPSQGNLTSERDIVGELSESVRKSGLKMGLYYSGGFDWTFNRGPIGTVAQDFEAAKPQSSAYGTYADAQAEELIQLYHPAVLWNDIDWPKSGNALKVIADYYNAVPDGVVDDRYGIPHSDFTSPEYAKLDQISPKKWEECRGLGASFGYNRAEGEKETIAPQELIELLVDIVSKNGNLLLDVGPEADGTVPPVQLDRLQKLGAWLKQNGEAIYGTKPWTRANGTTNQADASGRAVDVRFTQKDGHLYATLFGKPVSSAILLHNVTVAPGSEIALLGGAGQLKWTQKAADLEVMLPANLPGSYDWVLRLQPAK